MPAFILNAQACRKCPGVDTSNADRVAARHCSQWYLCLPWLLLLDMVLLNKLFAKALLVTSTAILCKVVALYATLSLYGASAISIWRQAGCVLRENK